MSSFNYLQDEYLKGTGLLDETATHIRDALVKFDNFVIELRVKNKEFTKSNGFIKKNKNVVFVDFNGVLSYNQFWVTLRDPKHELHKFHEQIENYLFKNNISIVTDWMVGKYSSEEIHHLLEKEVGVPYEKLFPIFCKECENIDISEKILGKIRELRQFYYCILITDNMDSFDRFTLTHNPQLSRSFDRIDNSYAMRCFKKTNNGQYFIDRVVEQDAIFENCILIDDSKNNCALFESLGGKAYKTQTEKQVLDALGIVCLNATTKWEWQY